MECSDFADPHESAFADLALATLACEQEVSRDFAGLVSLDCLAGPCGSAILNRVAPQCLREGGCKQVQSDMQCDASLCDDIKIKPESLATSLVSRDTPRAELASHLN
ncbi:unnamed protein product [Effrenium voratum]|uniref:Uncharacterized protein n=1 Tax=Effrenium voratum TaxID=2562239 RepID=A0AA36J3J5_9DINO|nr:unnamed protein product [Effrenium voratum]CAJ1426341.1 unnamed protein product [Effrenium voratum]